MKISTKTVHLGQSPDPHTGAINPPVYFSSTYEQEAPGQNRGYEYSRASHPNRVQLETAIAGLEGAKFGICFASGCAAATAVLSCLRPGDHVLASYDLYGGTYRLFMQIFARWGLKFSFVGEKESVSQIKSKITKHTKLFWLETPTNPLLHVFDIARFVTARGRHPAWILVDNTFATPILQNPIAHGADIVLHSTTKYMGGHSDVIGGALAVNDKELATQLHFYQKSAGAIPGPMDCYLTHRGIKTLAVRMKVHCENAQQLQAWLLTHPKVEHVLYPDWKHSSQMRAGGGMISFELKCSAEKLKTFFKRLKIICLAESLGGVESLICYPYTMTHGAVPPAQKAKIGISDRLARLSVGIEDWQDLRDDLNYALKGI